MKDAILQDIVVRSYEILRTGDPLSRAAALLRKSKLDGLPVLNPGGVLVGVLTKSNLYDAIASGSGPATPIES